MAKRKVEFFDIECEDHEKQRKYEEEYTEKHTLDSDEEDTDDRYNVMNENDIEGEEEGVSGIEGDTKFTPFNMKEELEEGHFDREGHFQWDKSKEIRDNWLDNIDWIKVKKVKKSEKNGKTGLADSSDSEDDSEVFNLLEAYTKILELMKPGETVKKTLQRLGRNSANISSAKRWERKKLGIVDEEAELVTKLTGLTNSILTHTGNMGIYQETYELIKSKVGENKGKDAVADEALDIYADDFVAKEKVKLGSNSSQSGQLDQDKVELEQFSNDVQWEYKWKQEDSNIYGPFSTEQMQCWVDEGYFKNGVFVRKTGEEKFYSSNRIDFELYL